MTQGCPRRLARTQEAPCSPTRAGLATRLARTCCLLGALATSLALGCAGARSERVAAGAPAEPERASSAPSYDGERALDRDADGLQDERDACPCAAEDRDEFEDGDGCPDLDDDGDMLLDVCDACPREPERWDGLDDDDGCPEPERIIVADAVIRIVPQLVFARGSATVRAESLPILDEIADVLREHPEITLLRVVGHADRRERAPERLAARRADAVYEALTLRGIEPGRLAVESRGASQPLDVGPSEASRARNRRVGFELAEPHPPPPAPSRPAPALPTEPTCPGGAPASVVPPAC